MLNNISIKKRLFLLTGFMSLMLLMIGLIGLRGIQQMVEEIDKAYEGSVDDIESLNAIAENVNTGEIETLHKLTHDDISWSQAEARLNKAISSINKNLNTFMNNAISTNTNSGFELDELVKKNITGMNKILEYIQHQDKTQLVNFFGNEMYPILDPLKEKLQELINAHIVETRQDYHSALQEAHDATIWMIIFLILSILISIAFAVAIIKSITYPLSKAVEAVDLLSLGDANIKCEISGNDESTQLMTSVQKMVDSTQKISSVLALAASGDLQIEVPIRSQNDITGKSLKQMIDALQNINSILGILATGNLMVAVPIRSQNDSSGKALTHMVESFRQIISEIQSEVNVLTNSTQEIVTSINQVSTGTSETAAAVTETTTTVEELKQTAHVSAEKAKDVLVNVDDTMVIVRNSEKTLHVTIDEMNQIQEKMRIISQSIVKLSEHSMAIGEIIDTVNNLAEQSNLLAVNAAIEAAKAGDQGKSFGVVAQEIRTLAEQSKDATVQVRAILNDIQNATSAAILATEQGSKAVTKGVSQSSQLSEAIHALSTSISKVTLATNQIAISSQQQLIGVDQVTIAMTNINEASSQHVEHMRQIENAVGLLNKVAFSLKALVSQYKIS